MPEEQWDDLERRRRDRTASSLTLEEHAAITAAVRFGDQTPSSLDKQQFTEGNRMKEAVRSVLGRIKPTENVQQVRTLIGTQLPQAVELVTTKLIRSDMELITDPSPELIARLLKLTPKQRAVILRMEKPQLGLELDLPFRNYLEALNANRKTGQKETHVDRDYLMRWLREPVQQAGQVRWRPHISEAIQEVNNNPWPGHRLDGQARLCKELWTPQGLRKPNNRRYAELQLSAITVTGEPLDQRHYSSVLEEEITQIGPIPSGSWKDGCQVCFNTDYPDVICDFSRLRPSVVGEWAEAA